PQPYSPINPAATRKALAGVFQRLPRYHSFLDDLTLHLWPYPLSS
ncbi:hypothetical protein RB213_014100, partial [Colletotrichum asianum]